MDKLRPTNRLMKISSFIGRAAGVVDVGTDHGFLPVRLAQSGAAGRIVATDISAGPLRHAITAAESRGVADRIEFVRTDGLDGIEPRGIDTVVIAGMGGENMAAILDRAEWVRPPGVRLVLQPQTKLPRLLAWLRGRGFVITDAALVEDGGRIYTVLGTQGDGSSVLCNTEEPSPCVPCVPRALLDKRDALLPKYLDRQIARVKRVISGLEKSAGGAGGLPELRRELAQLGYLREETEKWQR